ncbi:MAG: hypothetical protein RLZZ627_1811 [Pseudomonadota bacterium]
MTDGTVGTAGHLGAPQALSGSDVKITQDMGTTAGHNVFQSFKEFNIGSGQTVTFTESSTNFVNNVIARVTGKDTSNINGTLSVTPGGHANFYLLNPNGVMFGHGAQIDVPGDFHVTTAHFVKFQDGAKYGSDPVHSHLSTTEPASFGFSSSSHSNNVLIDVTDGAQLKNPTTPNTAIDLVAQNIKIENGATVSANDVRLVAAKGNMSVSLSNDVYGNVVLPKLSPTAANSGKVLVDGAKTLVTSGGDGGGRVAVWGNDVSLTNHSMLSSTNEGSVSASPSNGIDVRGVDVSVNYGSSIISIAKGQAQSRGGDIKISASGNLVLKNVENQSVLKLNKTIEAITIGGGAAGNIHLSAGERIDAKNSSIISISDGPGAAGNIYMTSSSARMNNSFVGTDNGLHTENYCMDCGALGSIYVVNSSSLVMSNSSQIFSENNSLYKAESSLSSLPSKGYGGGIKVIASSVILQGGASINSVSLFSPMDPVFVLGNKAISVLNHSNIITHQDTPLYVYSFGNVIVSGRSGISAFVPPMDGVEGVIGGVHLRAESLVLNDHAFIGTAASKGRAVGGGVYLNVRGLFSVGNVLNGNIFTGGDEIIPRNPIDTLSNIPVGGSQLGAVGTKANTVLSGSLLNLSGAMANLPPAKFKLIEIPNACEVANTGSLSLSGKGRNSSSALDRVIYGY